MVYDIKIGKYKLGLLTAVNIKRSVEQLADTAIITLPGVMYNKAINSTDSTLDYLEKSIKAGDEVTIKLGYNDTLATEFTGCVEHIENDNDQIKLYCEDGIYNYRKSLPNIEHKNITVKKLLSWVITQLQLPHQLACDYDVTYDRFVVTNCTGYDVLKKIQEELKPNIYFKDNILHVHPQYSEVFGTANYDFSVNIEESKLKYKNAEQRKILVEVNGKDRNGRVVKVEEGTTGGDKITVNISGISDRTSLQKIARETLLAKGVYTGYEGQFTGWLIPYCDAGYKINITDKDYEYKNGTYYVLSVDVNFDENGGKRTITIGKKLQ